MRYNLHIVVSRALAYLQLALITATVARTIWLKFRWLLSANQMITLESLHLAALSTSSTSWKNWCANCIRWFWGAMVAPHNFFPSLYLHCLLILTEILQYNGTMMRSTMGLMDGVGDTIKRVVYVLFKSRYININTAEEFSADAFKGVSSIKSLYLSQEDKIIKPRFVKNAPAIKRYLDVHHIKRDYILESVCFLEFCY